MSTKLRSWAGEEKSGFSFFCPGCGYAHALPTSPGGWSFDGNLDAPTFAPSVLVTLGEKVECHSFVRAGMIEFLSDCTHKLAGQTVPLPDWPAHYAGGDLPEPA